MRRCRPSLGTFVEVDCDRPEAIGPAFAEIERVHRLMSAHERDSELSRINRLAHREPVTVSDETREVVERALRWYSISGGLFDVVTAGARSLERGKIPRHSDQPEPEGRDSSLVWLSGNLLRLAAPACLDLGGIAKGYAVDRAAAAMREAGAINGLVNAGGDLIAFGPEPRTVEVVDPLTSRPAVEVELSNEALATSALVDGSAAHLPPAYRWSSVTVRAPNASDADALTKIIWAGGTELLAQVGASAFGIRLDGNVEEICARALVA